MNKQNLIQKLKQLDGLTTDEKAALIELVKTKKKYGLVWEDKPEAVEEQLRQYLPVLKEVIDKRILAKDILLTNNLEVLEHEKPDRNKPAPNHILIDGDNLHALTALSFTHEGKIDVIYIDPPYNTGNKDFKYNDQFVDKEDSYRHSKWLSFMSKRLRIAKDLLNEEGVIFISIDDNEQSQLKLIADEIFTEKCFVVTIPVIMNLKGNPDNYGFSDTHEYCLVYTKKEKNCRFGSFTVDEEAIDGEWDEDEYGLFKRADTLRRTGQDASREKRPKGFFPVFITSDNNIYVTDDDLPRNSDDTILFPTNEDGIELSWTWGKIKITNESHNLTVVNGRSGKNIYKKQRPQLGDVPTKKPKSFFYKPEYSTSTSTTDLKKILGSKIFDAPKPVAFVSDLISIAGSRNCKVLDFFAGSGTTLHSTMKLNAEDGGNRQCILITNNENNICEEVTFVRNKKVIEGYVNTKGNQINGLTNNNLRYFRSEFVSSSKTEVNKRLLTQASTELLQIKEDCYTDLTLTSGFNPMQCGVFTDEIGKFMIVVYHSRNQSAVCEQLIEYIKYVSVEEPIKLYAFSPEKETLAADFIEVADKIDPLPLPEAIYNAYRATFRTLRLDKKIINPAEMIETEIAPELFDTPNGA